MIDYCKFPHICNDAMISEGVTIEGNVYIKTGVKIAESCEMRSDVFKLVIEENVEIQDSVLIVNATGEDLRIKDDSRIGRGSKIFASIGKNCQIGENVEIQSPVGDNCVVESNSIVDDPLPSNTTLKSVIKTEIS